MSNHRASVMDSHPGKTLASLTKTSISMQKYIPLNTEKLLGTFQRRYIPHDMRRVIASVLLKDKDGYKWGDLFSVSQLTIAE